MSKPITAKKIQQLAKLSNINLSEQEAKKLKGHFLVLTKIMGKIEKMELDQQKETVRVTEEENIFREDIVNPSLTQEAALSNGNRIYKGFFVVEAILDKE